MRFVGMKRIDQQDIQAVHRIRERLVHNRTALVNQIRGLLTEYGIVIANGVAQLRKKLPEIIEDKDNEISDYARGLFNELLTQLYHADDQIEQYDQRIEMLCRESEVCQRLVKVPGIGSLTATAMVATIGDAKVFKNGREMAAFIGLVPKQHSSGGKQLLLGISKRGDRYLRCLLIHGARSVVTRGTQLSEKRVQWLTRLQEQRGRNKAIVALANKNARTLWALMAREESYTPIY
jgi:transposase